MKGARGHPRRLRSSPSLFHGLWAFVVLALIAISFNGALGSPQPRADSTQIREGATDVSVVDLERRSARDGVGQTDVVDADKDSAGDSESARIHGERDARLSSAPQNVAHAAVVLALFILGLNWIREGLEAGAL